MLLSSLPKVSILIPAYNETNYIEKALKAAIKQSYPNFEIIVANNASTDSTALVVKQFIAQQTSLHVKVLLVEENRQGTNYARECARLAATGSIIAQMDADCIPAADWLAKGVSLLCHGKRVAVTGPYDYYDGGQWMRQITLLSQRLLYPFTNLFVQLTGRAAILIGGNAFIRAEVLEKAGGYNTALTFYGDDVDMGTTLSVYGKVVYATSLVQKSSSRRYKAIGFWQVNKKYQSHFWNLVWNKNNLVCPTMETSHPR